MPPQPAPERKVVAAPRSTAPAEPALVGTGLVARSAGAARAGRDRRHRFPARTRRITAAFTDAEYAALAAAARRVGLTPTGFCAQAALAVTSAPTTASSGPQPAGVDPSGGSGGADWADPRLEALAALQAEMAALRTAVVRVGTNLNQAVAVLHAVGEAPVWLRHVAEQCGRVLGEVDAAASRVHRRLL
jgi:hypothetical protein